MLAYQKHLFVQRFFLAVGTSFVLLICASMITRSMSRRPLFSRDSAMPQAEGGSESSAVRIQDFHRVGMKDGHPKWDVKATEARFVASTGITHVSDADVVIYQDDGSKVFLKAPSAKLTLKGGALDKAEMSGRIELTLDNGIKVIASVAQYLAEAQEVRAAGPVDIYGDGFLIQGIGLRVDTEVQYMELEREVKTKFVKSLGTTKIPTFKQ